MLIALVATKVDLVCGESKSMEQGRLFAQHHGWMFCSTSAKSNIGVSELFEHLATWYIDSARGKGKRFNFHLSKTLSFPRFDSEFQSGALRFGIDEYHGHVSGELPKKDRSSIREDSKDMSPLNTSRPGTPKARKSINQKTDDRKSSIQIAIKKTFYPSPELHIRDLATKAKRIDPQTLAIYEEVTETNNNLSAKDLKEPSSQLSSRKTSGGWISKISQLCCKF